MMQFYIAIHEWGWKQKRQDADRFRNVAGADQFDRRVRFSQFRTTTNAQSFSEGCSGLFSESLQHINQQITKTRSSHILVHLSILKKCSEKFKSLEDPCLWQSRSTGLEPLVAPQNNLNPPHQFLISSIRINYESQRQFVYSVFKTACTIN